MGAATLALLAVACFALGFRFYSRYLSDSVFGLRDRKGAPKTPAHTLRDGVDYVPTRPSILFGHHFASIAGAAPIVGPAVAIIWGWVPALLWVVFGTIFLGAVHDFGALVISMKHQGRSVGQVCEKIIGPRSRSLFLVVMFFLVFLVIAVFALVIANLFVSYPTSVIPVNFQIIVALLIGYFVNRKGGKLLAPTVLAQLALLAMIALGADWAVTLDFLGGDPVLIWIVFLMIYSYIASTLPVWLLLQPRDYINSYMLFLGLAGLLLGVVIVNPPVVAPAINPDPVGAPAWFPFLFITIACGAISGFHGLVSSGTTSKQIGAWKDARPIGYGGMLGEGLLALLATLAVAAGFASAEDWHQHYASWNQANGLGAKIGAFVAGSGTFLEGLHLPKAFAGTFMAVLIISFSATTLDTAARIQRYIVGELGEVWKIPVLKNRHIGGLVAIGTAFLLIFAKGGGKGGLVLWPLFGATNQLLAALTLVVISLFVLKMKKNALPFLIPVVIMVTLTTLGLVLNIRSFIAREDWLLTVFGSVLLIVDVWIVGEGVAALRRLKRSY